MGRSTQAGNSGELRPDAAIEEQTMPDDANAAGATEGLAQPAPVVVPRDFSDRRPGRGNRLRRGLRSRRKNLRPG